MVGWLVCIEGEYKGESFKLKSGRNFIGRAANMDVVLSADHSVSRFKHASVIYEPRGRQFIVSTGESRELCYLNDEVVLSNMKMKAYDVLNLGNTSLMLIPCCERGSPGKMAWKGRSRTARSRQRDELQRSSPRKRLRDPTKENIRRKAARLVWSGGFFTCRAEENVVF